MKIAGHTYTSPSAALFNSSITAGTSFTLPMGKNSSFTFTVTIPASLASPLGGLPDGSPFRLDIPPGKLVLTFDFFPSVGALPVGYYVLLRGSSSWARPNRARSFYLRQVWPQ